MAQWSKSPCFHVRRLASEGLRPRLPWAKKLTTFSQNPSPIITILENLKADPSAYVRKSVANNLNDLLKENYPFTLAGKALGAARLVSTPSRPRGRAWLGIAI